AAAVRFGLLDEMQRGNPPERGIDLNVWRDQIPVLQVAATVGHRKVEMLAPVVSVEHELVHDRQPVLRAGRQRYRVGLAVVAQAETLAHPVELGLDLAAPDPPSLKEFRTQPVGG